MISNDSGDTGGMRRRKIGNICQQYHARAIVLKLALQQVIGHRIGLQGFRQLPIGIRLPDGAKQVELFHQMTDFLLWGQSLVANRQPIDFLKKRYNVSNKWN